MPHPSRRISCTVVLLTGPTAHAVVPTTLVILQSAQPDALFLNQSSINFDVNVSL